MRVLFLTDSLSDLDGVGRYTYRLIAALEELEPGLEVEVLLARKHRPTSSQVPKHWRVRVALPPDYFFYMKPSRFWPSLALSTYHVARAARGADLVHAIKDYPHSWVAQLGARIAGVPCVATAHGTYTVQPLLDPRHAARARRVYARFGAMISVSGYTRRRLLEVLPPPALDPARVHVIPNCVEDPDYFASAPRLEGPPRAWHGLQYTLGIGETKERKGHHLALEAWLALAPSRPELHHFIVGKRSGDAYEQQLHASIARAGCSERVHFLGNVSEAEKLDLLQRALLFVHTPVTAADGGFEGFGIVYLEASACGLAVIGTRESGAEDAIEHERTGLLVEQEPRAVQAALERLLGDAELRAHMGAAGREHARRADWRQNARRVLALYRELLA